MLRPTSRWSTSESIFAPSASHILTTDFLHWSIDHRLSVAAVIYFLLNSNRYSPRGASWVRDRHLGMPQRATSPSRNSRPIAATSAIIAHQAFSLIHIVQVWSSLKLWIDRKIDRPTYICAHRITTSVCCRHLGNCSRSQLGQSQTDTWTRECP